MDRGNNTPHAYWSHFNNNCNGLVYIGVPNVGQITIHITGKCCVLIVRMMKQLHLHCLKPNTKECLSVRLLVCAGKWFKPRVSLSYKPF